MAKSNILQIIFLEINLNSFLLHRSFFPLLLLWLVNLNLRPSLILNLGMDSTIPLSIKDIQVILTTIIYLLTLLPTNMPWLPVLFNPTMANLFNLTTGTSIIINHNEILWLMSVNKILYQNQVLCQLWWCYPYCETWSWSWLWGQQWGWCWILVLWIWLSLCFPTTRIFRLSFL